MRTGTETGRERPNDLAEIVPPWVTLVFAAAVLYQIFHWVEHVAQTYQHWWLSLPSQEAHGILFFFDAEWNHFTFNTLYWVGLIAVAGGMRIWRKSPRELGVFPFWSFVIGGLLVETYHEVEHIFKISQHVLYDCQACPGILGYYVDLIYYHFWLNTVVLLFPLIAFIAWGFTRRAWRYA